MSALWYTLKEDGHKLVLNLHIQPNASKTEIAGLHGDALKVKVAAPPADHQANDKLLEFLRKSFKVSKSQVVLKHGEHSRQKVVEILDPPIAPETLLA
ncbi:major facilitator transporter [Novimethylophilus kurashikiensis]|uniref:UPF0235 protein NMK_3245 n=1 Tax=Novimethylophilus kurashikiensis TaxID=1825523 RepID=A0A2R5FI48_9PROT|nr:DUF167 family protein [Novimethylophilus kurashikiensis]GBG15634.1 major facilitator transporter [Novimethylophilus kurashikiensis]